MNEYSDKQRSLFYRADDIRKKILSGADGIWICYSDLMCYCEPGEYNNLTDVLRDLIEFGYVAEQYGDGCMEYKTTLKGMWLYYVKYKLGFVIPIESKFY